MKLTKTYDVTSFKALPSEGEGTFEAIVSVFSNVDLQGDRVVPGAFSKSIEKWKSSGDKVPVIWSHDWADPFAHIGYVDPGDMHEIAPGKAGALKGGLLVKGHLDVDKPFAKQVYDLLAERRVTEFSFAYDVPAGGEQRGKDGANELHTLDILEVGPTLKGANTETVLLGVKSRLDEAAALEHGGKHGTHDQSEHGNWADGGGGGHITESGAQSTGTPEQEREAQGVLEELVSADLVSEDVIDEVADPTLGSYDALHDLVAAGHIDFEMLDEVRRGLGIPRDSALFRSFGLWKGSKAGRVIGSKATAALKSRLNDAVDAFVAEMNGSAEEKAAEPDPAKELEPGDEKDFARGYADASAGRKSLELTTEYVRGYDEGRADRATVEHAEVADLNAKLSDLLEA